MSFHFSNLGMFSGELQAFADLDGYIPEAGDEWFDFQWPAGTCWDKDTWQEYVCGAVRATVRAEKSLAAWREGRVDDDDQDDDQDDD
jgi:hypothetical protein